MSESPTDPVGALREEIAAACADLHDAIPAPTLERPPRAELGDYSTNAAMLAAPLLGAPPREVAERLSTGIGERLGSLGGADRGRRAGLPQPAHVRVVAARVGGTGTRRRGQLRGGGPGAGRGRPGRVRQRQPDRAADGRQRPPCRLRRLAGPRARVRRPPPGQPRVLPQRRRRPDRPLRAVDRGPDGGRRGSRGRLRGRLRGRSRRAHRRRGRGRLGSGGALPPRRRADDRVDQGDARPDPRPLRRLELRARAPRRRGDRGGDRRPAGGRARLRERRGRLAAHLRVRRRQGPRADPLERDADLLRRRRRLPPRQARARARS